MSISNRRALAESLVVSVLLITLLGTLSWYGASRRIFASPARIVAIKQPQDALAVWENNKIHGRTLYLFDRRINAMLHAAHHRLLSWQRVLHLIAVYALLPAAIYVLTFYPWFGRGYSLPEFFQMQPDAYNKLQNQPLEEFANAFFRTTPSSPWEWFVNPLMSGVEVSSRGVWGKFFIFMSNAPFWLLTIPAVFYASFRSWKDRDWRLVFVVLLFLSLYLQFVFVDRPIFLYSAVVVLPFVYLLVANFLRGILGTFFRSTLWSYGALLTGICLWGSHLYPLVTSKYVPVFPYKPLVNGPHMEISSPLRFAVRSPGWFSQWVRNRYREFESYAY